MPRALFLATAIIAFTTCGVDLPDVAGRACDETHECRAPRECVGGLCVDVDVVPEDGGDGGGTAAGGGAGGGGVAGGIGGGGGGGGGGIGGGTAGGTGGGGGIGGAGGGTGGSGGGAGGAGGGISLPPLWKQGVHGFTTQSVLGSATLEVDSTRANRVASTIQNSLDTNDRATANQTDGGRLPKTGSGKIRGRFQIPSALKLTNSSTFLWLATGTKPLVQLYFNSAGQLVTFSAPGMLAPGSVANTITWADGGFRPGIDYLVEVEWQRGNYRRVWINGALLAQATGLTGDAGILEVPDQLRLGIYRYEGTSDAGWSIALTDWQLTDNPSVVLSD